MNNEEQKEVFNECEDMTSSKTISRVRIVIDPVLIKTQLTIQRKK